LAESLVFSLFGLLFQLKVSASGFLFQKRSATEVCIPSSGLQVRADLITDHNREALENILAPFEFGGTDHSLLHISDTVAHRWAVHLVMRDRGLHSSSSAIVLTGFASHSEAVKLYMSITFAFLGACHLVSILGSPFYHHLSNLCISVVRATSGKRANL
jgi:hypothetical protein